LLDWRTKHSAALTPHYRFAKRRDGMVKHQAGATGFLFSGKAISSVSLIPVVLEDGLPRVEITESNRFGSR
jgi:hypothetical protein